jgi:hypothetical protein
MDPHDPVKVYVANDPQHAQIVCQVLENAGIPARLASEATLPYAGAFPDCPVWVAAEYADQARAVLKEYERMQVTAAETDDGEQPSESSTTFCFHCGSPVEPGALSCPQCQKPLV